MRSRPSLRESALSAYGWKLRCSFSITITIRHAHNHEYQVRGRCAPDAPLFISQKGNRMTRNALWKSFASKQRELGLDTGIHRFRHTFLSDVDHHANGSAALARDLGGHSCVAITNNYLHTTPEERRAAVNSMSYAGMLAELTIH